MCVENKLGLKFKTKDQISLTNFNRIFSSREGKIKKGKERDRHRDRQIEKERERERLDFLEASRKVWKISFRSGKCVIYHCGP